MLVKVRLAANHGSRRKVFIVNAQIMLPSWGPAFRILLPEGPAYRHMAKLAERNSSSDANM